MTILDQIVEQTAYDLKERKKKVGMRDFESMELYERQRRDFGAALRSGNTISVIAEIKKASPSKGVIRPDFNPVEIALQYREGGAAALSVLTDEPAFKGRLEYMASASGAVDIPVMRKDFIIDPYQVKEARAYGADAVLLIATVTDGNQLDELMDAAREFGLQCLVECYSEEDLKKINLESVDILGVNNRDLKTFKVDLHRGIELLLSAPGDTVLVSESGLGSSDDLQLLQEKGIHAALIGEYLMRRNDPGRALAELLEPLQNKRSNKNLEDH